MDRQDISFDITIQEMMVQMCEGNPGGLSVIIEIMKRRPDDGVILLCHLDDMNIRGSQIWVGFKYYCGQDLDKFIGCIVSRNEEMIAKINEMMHEQGFEWKATQLKEPVRPKFNEA